VFVDLLTRGDTDADLPYLFRAVTNRCLNLVRDRANRQRLHDRHDPAAHGPVRTRCEDLVVNLDLLGKLMDRLDSRSVEILVYRFFDDLTQEEIAELLSVSRKTVYKRLDRIREVVRELSSGVAP
jgi:RNA polymerase sigma-70 factor (ECF subfamily)